MMYCNLNIFFEKNRSYKILGILIVKYPKNGK